jgi:hypothetical protein
LLQQAKQQIAASSGCGVHPKREAFESAVREALMADPDTLFVVNPGTGGLDEIESGVAERLSGAQGAFAR